MSARKIKYVAVEQYQFITCNYVRAHYAQVSKPNKFIISTLRRQQQRRRLSNSNRCLDLITRVHKSTMQHCYSATTMINKDTNAYTAPKATSGVLAVASQFNMQNEDLVRGHMEHELGQKLMQSTL
jgi:hypothetical protein